MNLHVIRLTLELRTPLHIGSGSDNPLLDAPVIRDAFGDYRLPGASLAGAARAFAAERGLAGLFGRGDTEACASAIEFSDGYLVDWDCRPVIEKRLTGVNPTLANTLEVQEHVRIDHGSGAADDAGKFDTEVIPQGLRFRVEMTFQDSLARGLKSPIDAPEAFGLIAKAFAEGLIPLGGDVTSGLGSVAAVPESTSHEVFDLMTVAGLEAAFRRPSAISVALARPGLPEVRAMPRVAGGAEVLRGWVRLRLRTDGPLLVGGSQHPRPRGRGQHDLTATADIVFGETLVADYQSKQFHSLPWVPGSSLKGALRHRVWHVAEAAGQPDPKSFVDGLFGSLDGPRARRSKVSVSGHLFDDEPRTVVQHVAIDRLTGGSLRGALYTEAPIWKDGLELDVNLHFADVSLAEAALLSQALVDLAVGELPVGGGVNRGNGTLKIAAAQSPSSGLGGRAVSFEVAFGDHVFRHDSPRAELEEFLDRMDAAANPADSGEEVQA